MGKMKELYTALQETERLLREYDPVAFEAGRRLVESAQAIVLAQADAQARAILSGEHQPPTPL
jgi:hypothetical protein